MRRKGGRHSNVLISLDTLNKSTEHASQLDLHYRQFILQYFVEVSPFSLSLSLSLSPCSHVH